MATVPAPGDWLRISGNDLLLQVRVQPRASRSRLDAIEDGLLHLRVGAAPVDRGANRAVVELLAATLGIARGRLSITRGERSRAKQVRIAGAAEEVADLRARLVAALAQKRLNCRVWRGPRRAVMTREPRKKGTSAAAAAKKRLRRPRACVMLRADSCGAAKRAQVVNHSPKSIRGDTHHG